MARTATRYALIVIDDGERVLNETYEDDTARADALHEAISVNHDEIEPAPSEVVADGTEAVLSWYAEDLDLVDLDVYVDEIEVAPTAPNQLYHVVTIYPEGEVGVDSFVSATARKLGLVERAAHLELDTDDEEEIVEQIEAYLDAQITLVDADLHDDDFEWHGYQ